MTGHPSTSPMLWRGLLRRGTAPVCVASVLLTWPQAGLLLHGAGAASLPPFARVAERTP